jgi:hypothetical protein
MPTMDTHITTHPTVQLMANFMNYLSVSLYESEFTKNHEDSYATLKSIYDNIILTPSELPQLHDIKQFYENIVYLGNVTYTDDPDYYTYKRSLRKYIVEMKVIPTSTPT